MEAQIEVVTPEVEQVQISPVGFTEQIEEEKKNALALYEKIQAVSIITVDDYTFADGLLKDVKAKYKFLEDTEEGMIKPMRDGYNNARKKIIDFFSSPKEKLEKAKTILNKAMIDWAEEQKRKERELQRQLEEDAKKRAEQQVLEAAIEAEAAGEKEEAEQIIAEPVYVPPIRVVSEIPKSKESHIRETWSAEIIDLKTLVTAIVANSAPVEAVEPNMTFLNGQARSYKQSLNIPGVRAVSKKTQI